MSQGGTRLGLYKAHDFVKIFLYLPHGGKLAGVIGSIYFYG